MARFLVVISLLQLARAYCVSNPTNQTTVHLDYATYQGVGLESGVDIYLGMRYAAPPLGDLRFRAPAEPVVEETCVQDASAASHPIPIQGNQQPSKTDSSVQFRPICIGTGQAENSNRAEDCLFVNVFTPTKATPQSKLPVWVYIQGGGYASNANANYNGVEVVQGSGDGLVFVNFNYRVGALGFLASEKVRQNGDLNVGLLDQRKVLQWVQQYIHLFGGDPEHVVIHGASAGAGSVAHLLTAYGGRDDGLFIGAVPENSFWPTLRTVAEMEAQFDLFVEKTGCSDSQDPLDCLRTANLTTIQAGNVNAPFPGGPTSPDPLWYFLPVIDGDLVPDTLYEAFDGGQFIKVPVLVGDDTNEGSYFAYNAANQAQISQFFQANYPHLNTSQLELINAQYPLMAALPDHAKYFPSCSAAYGDATFTCAGNEIASTMARHVSADQVWNYRFNVLDPSNLARGLGVPHTFETAAIFGTGVVGNPPSTYLPGHANAAIVPIMMDYFISFITNLDPNPQRNADAPVWQPWGHGTGQRLRLQTNDTAMESVPQDQTQHCHFWRSLARTMEV